MDTAPAPLDAPQQEITDFDVLIIGAGISGIDAAYHLNKAQPETRFAILESMSDLGGTWRTHRFPGIRSDSDLYTFGFKWKPWTGIPIATGEEILDYLNDAMHENDLRRHARFGHRVETANWDSKAQRWVLSVRRDGDEEPVEMTTRFLWMCAGYYRHTDPYKPTWSDMDQFQGQIVHPQDWPDDLDHAGKRIVVIGSGATAATLVPALAKTAQHVTMLQRSPTYYFPKPMQDEFTDTLRALDLPDDWFHEIMRRRYLLLQQTTVRRSFEEPQAMADELIEAARQYLGDGFDLKTHFTPSYRPWRQRLAMIPDGDLFIAIRAGQASVVTDQIDRFTPTGLRLGSGQDLAADIVVSATGMTLNVLGDVALKIDGTPVDLSQSFTHRGVMFTGVPNLVNVFGYLRSSWTLRADLVSDYVCRLLTHMAARGAVSVTPVLRETDRDMQTGPWIDPENFNAGYIQRSLHLMPKQGDKQPWLMTQDYFSDRETLPDADLDDGTLRYT